MTREELLQRLSKNCSRGLWIEPLLEEDQIQNLTIDLRLGCEFLVSIVTRNPSINIHPNIDGYNEISNFFRPTRRSIGENFILYPNQVVLTTSLEYIGLPCDCYADIFTRKSFISLGIDVNSMIEPGYRGCISLALLNHGNNPIELVVGTRLVQMRLVKQQIEMDYGGFSRKYFGLVRPEPSRVQEDLDLLHLNKMGRHPLRKLEN